MGCQAKIKIKKFSTYPDYKITPEQTKGKSQREIQQFQKGRLEDLKSALKQTKPDVQVVTKYWVSMPSTEAHSGHPVGNNAMYSQRIHPLLVAKITEMVLDGITNTAEVKRSLRFYANTILASQVGIKFSKQNRAFFPTSIDIRNHIYAAKKTLELSKLDQENVRQIVEQHRKDPTSSFFFRPLIKQEVKTEQGCDDMKRAPNDDDLHPGCYKGNTGGDDIINIAGSTSKCQQTLLLVHQEQWQKELLGKYGNDICLIDATYKTTRYDIALFFICVKTNTGYTVVAEFVIQDETAQKIQEALEILKQWNPQWKPKYFMTDYSEAELLAIEKCFVNTKVFLCDFHREQAWERWVKDHKHGLSKQEQEELLSLLRACANTPSPQSVHKEVDEPSPGTEQDSNALQQAHNLYVSGYDLAVADLKASNVWTDNQEVQTWLSTYWLTIPKVST